MKGTNKKSSKRGEVIAAARKKTGHAMNWKQVFKKLDKKK
jgi:hypothetical protein